VVEIALEGPRGAQLAAILHEFLGFLVRLGVGALETLGFELQPARRIAAVSNVDAPKAATFALSFLELGDGGSNYLESSKIVKLKVK